MYPKLTAITVDIVYVTCLHKKILIAVFDVKKDDSDIYNQHLFKLDYQIGRSA